MSYYYCRRPQGTDEALVPIDGEYVKEAKIGRAIMDADIVISLTHFKGHEATGFGGTLKNLGMGSGSRAGKMEMHNAGKPFVHTDKCIGCGACQRNCAHSAITVLERKAPLIQASVLDAAAVSEPVPWMRWTPCATRPMIY